MSSLKQKYPGVSAVDVCLLHSLAISGADEKTITEMHALMREYPQANPCPEAARIAEEYLARLESELAAASRDDEEAA